MVNNIGKNRSKRLNSKYNKIALDHSKKSKYLLKAASKRSIQNKRSNWLVNTNKLQVKLLLSRIYVEKKIIYKYQQKITCYQEIDNKLWILC